MWDKELISYNIGENCGESFSRFVVVQIFVNRQYFRHIVIYLLVISARPNHQFW